MSASNPNADLLAFRTTGDPAAFAQAAEVSAPPALAAAVTTAATGSIGMGSAFGTIVAKLIGWKTFAAAVVAVAVVVAVVQLRPGPTPPPAQAAALPPTTAPANSPATIARPMPAVASLDPTQRRVYELIGQIRESIAPSRPEEWVRLLREFEQIGPPAVPALCAELDRTSSDKAQRLLLMALRNRYQPRNPGTLHLFAAGLADRQRPIRPDRR